MPCHSEIGQSKSLFLLTVALLCFQAKKLPFSHGNCDSDWLREWMYNSLMTDTIQQVVSKLKALNLQLFSILYFVKDIYFICITKVT